MTAIATENDTCSPETRVTRSLLGYGVLAGPLYVVTSVVQGLTREGFDFTRHEWSLLSNGDLGWIQITNFVVTGLMVMAAAVGLARAAGGWAPRLVGLYGLSLVAAGALRADPMLGFPIGTPEGPLTSISWHGMGHLVAGSVGFAGLIAACLVFGRRFAREGRRGWAAFSRITGLVFVASFAGIASGTANTVITLAFVGAVVLAWCWLAAVSAHYYRR
ncbi:DUF998 domain-containing protein [Streptosporangiaceae bacterium NEAU-GS5]|nr:DUF998 domain-containing protein [Streptosporangiaceae bacterium NEAU-GS5]